MMFKTSSSLYILTPSFNALSYFEPGLSPTITPVVFLVTELVTLAPLSSRILVNSSLYTSLKFLLKQTSYQIMCRLMSHFYIRNLSLVSLNPLLILNLKDLQKYVFTLLAIISPISLTFVSSSILTLIILSIFLYLLASILAVFYQHVLFLVQKNLL